LAFPEYFITSPGTPAPLYVLFSLLEITYLLVSIYVLFFFILNLYLLELGSAASEGREEETSLNKIEFYFSLMYI
jgi:hypothetical protein